MNLVDLSGKHLFVTGASSGIGRAVSILCSNLGANIIVTGRNVERLKETLSSLSGQEHKAIACDLTDCESVKNAVGQLPKLDGVVFCAGVQETCLTKNIDLIVLNKLLNTNYISTVLLNAQLMNQKKINKGASIVFISSVAASRYAVIGNAVYSSTKAALTSYARVLALELSSRHIRVNVISPGMVRTPLQEQFDVTPEQFQEDEKKYPLGYGEPDDVANTVAFLLSDAARWITGSDFLLDGGLSLK